jgi:hypothetical protein
VALADAGDESCADDRFAVLPPEDLDVPHLRSLAFRMQQREFAVALKPYFLQRLLDEADCALYLDPDVLVLADLKRLFAEVAAHTLTLVPHALSPPVTADPVERERAFHLAGVFNGGVIGVRRSATAAAFLTWWQRRVDEICTHAVDRGIHYDQRWLDLSLGLVDDVLIHRDIGVNVAHWNLPERPVRLVDGHVTAGGVPCRLFHFSGFNPADPTVPTRYRPDLRMDEVGEAERLFRDYAAALVAADWREARTAPYAYAVFDNGVRIPDVARRLYAHTPDARAFENPFGRDFFTWLTEGSPTRLWLFVHSERADLQRAFPHPEGRDRRRFLKWSRSHGAREHDIPPELV